VARIRKGDRVVVISGDDKGKQGKVVRVIPERSMIVVEIGNSSGREAKPKAPPIPPEAPTSNRWNFSEARFCRRSARVVAAALSAVKSAELAALLTTNCHPRGSNWKPCSMGLPTAPARRAVRPGFSSSALARASSHSSGGVSIGRIGGCSMSDITSSIPSFSKRSACPSPQARSNCVELIMEGTAPSAILFFVSPGRPPGGHSREPGRIPPRHAMD